MTSAGGTTGTVQVSAVSPGLFLTPDGHAAAENQNLSVNVASNPASPGSVVVLYLTGSRLTDQAISTGVGSPLSPPGNLLAAVSATLGTQTTQVVFSEMTPGTVGLAQVNIKVPATGPDGKPLPPGEYLVTSDNWKCEEQHRECVGRSGTLTRHFESLGSALRKSRPLRIGA